MILDRVIKVIGKLFTLHHVKTLHNALDNNRIEMQVIIRIEIGGVLSEVGSRVVLDGTRLAETPDYEIVRLLVDQLVLGAAQGALKC